MLYKMQFINQYNMEVFRVIEEKKIQNIREIFKRIENNKGQYYIELDAERKIDCQMVTYKIGVYDKRIEYRVYFLLKDVIFN